MKQIDIENWKRKEQFNFFYRADYPQYNICMNIDATNFLAFVKNNKLSFYYSMIYAVTRIANEMDDFRYRIRDGKVFLHDTVHPSFTDLNETEEDPFKLVTVDYKDDLLEFIQQAKEISVNQHQFIDFSVLEGRDDFLYITCIPWISFTHVSHTFSLNRNDSVPRISWGKYFREGEKVMLPFSVQVHHALIDGYMVGKYVEKLQKFLDNC